MDRIANSPEVLNAVANASVGLTGVVADEARKRTVTADEFAERIARRVLRRAPREPQPLALETASGETARRNRDGSERRDRRCRDREYAGIVSRGCAFAADVAIVQASIFAVGAVIALIAEAFGEVSIDISALEAVLGRSPGSRSSTST